jgi:putative sterol carrier protein
MPNVFQHGKSAGLDATFHFTFTGHEQRQATVVIQEQKLSVKEGHIGQPDLTVTADSQTWVGFLRGTAAAQDSAQRPTQAVGGIRRVLSPVICMQR